MSRITSRYLTGLLISGLILSGPSTLAHADGIQAPWFGNLSGAASSTEVYSPVKLAFSYISFWRYDDGFQWAQYNHWRTTLRTPVIYVARVPEVVPLPEPEPEPETKPDVPVPQPEPEPEPAPTPPDSDQPDSEPEPAPDPLPKPAPQPDPAPQQNPDESTVPPSTPSADGLTAEEQLMIDLVNEERAKEGLPALEVDLRLVTTARAKSQDMITYSYFSHQSPQLGSPFDQMKAAGIRYLTAGENIAGNQTVEAAHRALMKSPGHRANILNSAFKKIGIGIVQGGPYGLMITQQFIAE